MRVISVRVFASVLGAQALVFALLWLTGCAGTLPYPATPAPSTEIQQVDDAWREAGQPWSAACAQEDNVSIMTSDAAVAALCGNPACTGAGQPGCTDSCYARGYNAIVMSARMQGNLRGVVAHEQLHHLGGCAPEVPYGPDAGHKDPVTWGKSYDSPDGLLYQLEHGE